MELHLSYEQVEEMLAGYALGALEPDEMLAVDEYLQAHRALLDRLVHIEEAVAHLPRALADEPLPEDARERLMARVRADSAAHAVESAVRPTVHREERSLPPETVMSRREAFVARFWGGLNRWSVATAVALLILMTLYAVQVNRQLASTAADLVAARDELAQLEAANSELQQANDALRQELQVDQRRLAQLASARRAVALSGTEAAPEAGGCFFLSGDEGLLALIGLDPLPADQTYQFWLIPAQGDPISAGLVSVAGEPVTWAQVEMPVEAGEFASVGVSVEPAGGSEAPTGPIVLLGQLNS